MAGQKVLGSVTDGVRALRSSSGRPFVSAVTAVITWACLSFSVAPAPAQTCAGDCNANGEVTIDEVLIVIQIALGSVSPTVCASADTDSNGQVAMNEVVKVLNNMFFRCGTLPVPPNLEITVHNAAGVSPGTVQLSGRCVQNADSGDDDPAPQYALSLTDPRCASCGAGCTRCSLVRVEPGVWQHDVLVTNTPNGNAEQRQYTTNLIVRDTSSPAAVEWTIFRSVYEVNETHDAGDGNCGDGTCTLRDAATEANNTTQTPALIQFKRDAPAFPNGEAVITLTNNGQLTLAKAGTVVDGTTVIHSGPLLDARAQPSAVDPFAARRSASRTACCRQPSSRCRGTSGSTAGTGPRASSAARRWTRASAGSTSRGARTRT